MRSNRAWAQGGTLSGPTRIHARLHRWGDLPNIQRIRLTVLLLGLYCPESAKFYSCLEVLMLTQAVPDIPFLNPAAG